MTNPLSRKFRGVTGRLGAVVAATVAAATLHSAPASAYVQQVGATGAGAVIGYQVQGSHYDTCLTVAYSCWNSQVFAPGPLVYRSPSTGGQQQIAAVYLLQIWTGRTWVNLAQRQHIRYLGAGYGRLQLPAVEFLPDRAGSFRVMIGVAWRSPDGKRLLGSRSIGFVHAGDYACNTRFPCRTGAGFVWLRSPDV